MRLTLKIIIASLGLLILPAPAQAQVSESQVGSLVEALRLAAPQTGRADDGLYSSWQVMPANIPRWSKQCIGRSLTPTEFEANVATARTILACVMSDVFKKEYRDSGANESQAVQRAASWWMTGDPSRYNNDRTAAYTKKVLGFYQKLRSQISARTVLSPSPQPVVIPPQPISAAKQPVIVNPSETSSPATTTKPTAVTDAQVNALVEALRLSAAKTSAQNSGTYSEWQVLAANIPRWSQQCIGRSLTPAEFSADAATARTILVCVMRDILENESTASGNNESQAVQRAAAWWMTGDATRYTNSQTAPYTKKVLAFYQRLRSNQPENIPLLPHR